MDYAIELKNLSKQYKDFHLDKINLSLKKGTIMGFVGENGAGKTTTLKAILNLVHIDEGEIKVFGKDHIEHEKKIKSQIGVIAIPSILVLAFYKIVQHFNITIPSQATLKLLATSFSFFIPVIVILIILITYKLSIKIFTKKDF